MKKGKIIVIEGADGTGKATQTELLKERLEKNGYKVDSYDFPQYTKTFFGALVGRFLKGEFGGLKEVSPYLASVLYAGDRWQAKGELENTVKKGRIALLNRYATSSMAFQSAKLSSRKRFNFVHFIEEMEYGIFTIPREELDIVLTVPPKLSQKLIKMKAQRSYLGGKRKKDIHEADVKYQLEVSKFYKTLAKKYKHMKMIDCSTPLGGLKSIDEIHENIWKIVEKVLN
jgi:dTMP kinase